LGKIIMLMLGINQNIRRTPAKLVLRINFAAHLHKSASRFLKKAKSAAQSGE
jgi:hypothetical protein